MTLPVIYADLSPRERKRVRIEYVERQGGLCAYCSESLEGDPHELVESISVPRWPFPPGFFSNPVHLHHCHETGLTIGAVHAKCNAVLWLVHGQ